MSALAVVIPYVHPAKLVPASCLPAPSTPATHSRHLLDAHSGGPSPYATLPPKTQQRAKLRFCTTESSITRSWPLRDRQGRRGMSIPLTFCFTPFSRCRPEVSGGKSFATEPIVGMSFATRSHPHKTVQRVIEFGWRECYQAKKRLQSAQNSAQGRGVYGPHKKGSTELWTTVHSTHIHKLTATAWKTLSGQLFMDKFVTKVVVWRCTSRRPFRRSVCPPSEGHRFGEKNCNIWNNKQSKEQHHSFGRCWKLKLMENKICIVLGRSGTHTHTHTHTLPQDTEATRFSCSLGFSIACY